MTHLFTIAFSGSVFTQWLFYLVLSCCFSSLVFYCFIINAMIICFYVTHFVLHCMHELCYINKVYYYDYYSKSQQDKRRRYSMMHSIESASSVFYHSQEEDPMKTGVDSQASCREAPSGPLYDFYHDFLTDSSPATTEQDTVGKNIQYTHPKLGNIYFLRLVLNVNLCVLI